VPEPQPCGTPNRWRGNSTGFADLPVGALRFGSAGRTILIGPGLNQWDLRVAKNTRFGERYRSPGLAPRVIDRFSIQRIYHHRKRIAHDPGRAHLWYQQ